MARSESFQIWSILSGAQGLDDLPRCARTVAELIKAPVRLTWPAPYGQPQTADSPHYHPAWPHPPHTVRIPSTTFPSIAPELEVQFAPGVSSPAIPADITEALAERWRRTLAESIQTIDQVWNQMWLTIHAGIKGSGDLLALIASGAEAVARSEATVVAVRDSRLQTLTVAHAVGLRHSLPAIRLPLYRGVGGFVLESQESVTVDNYPTSHWQDPIVRTWADSEALTSGMAVPFSASEGTDGVLYALFRSPGAPSPLALMALQRYVRSIRPVLFSAQSASPYSYSVSLTRFAENSHAGRLLAALRLSRRQGAWHPLQEAASQEGLYFQITDAWGQMLHASADIAPTGSPNRTATVDGLEPTLLSLWSGHTELLADAIYPHLLQTVTLLLNTETQRANDHLKAGQQWFQQMSSPSLDERQDARKQSETLGISKDIVQIWCVVFPTLPHNILISPMQALMRYLEREIDSVPLVDSERVWFFLPHPMPIARAEEMHQAISRKFGQSSFWVGMHSALDPATVNSVLSRVRESLDNLVLHHPEGGVQFANRPALENFLCLPEVKSALLLFAEEWTGPVSHYDQTHHTQLMKTLELYLATGSLTQTAQSLYIHPNTARNRLQQIMSLMPSLAWDDPDVRLALALAARAWGGNFPTPC